MNKYRIGFALCAMTLSVLAESCSHKITAEAFGKDKDGGAVQIYTLTNKQGTEARITPYGATLVSLKIPDRKGLLADVVMGFDSLGDYIRTSPPPYFGATIGRYANRIGGAKFTLNGKTYTLDKNDGANSLHGGFHGFDTVLWTAKPSITDDGQSLELSFLSRDGRLSRQSLCHCLLHANRRKRAAHPLHGNHG
jgi:aldose 1-epimerase